MTDSTGTVELCREILGLDIGTQSGQLWFRAPQLYSAADNVFYLYYGHPDFNEENDPDVWSNGYVAVYHLEESGTGATGEYADQTANRNDGAGGGGLNVNCVPVRAAGKIGYGQNILTETVELVNYGDFIDIPNSPSLATLGPVTISCWVNPAANAGRLYAKQNGLVAWFQNSATRLNLDRPTDGTKINLIKSGTATSMQHLATVYDGAFNNDAMEIYRNGAPLVSTVGGGDGTGNLTDESAGFFRIGNVDWYDPANAGSNRCVNGLIDELRIANVVRSAVWIGAEYSNQNDPAGFYTVGAEETL